MTRIESLLRKKIGLDSASIGSSQIQRTIRLHMKNLGLKKPEEYERLLEKSKTELDELIETVVVTETWFFRDREPFAAFTKLALEWLPQHPGGTLRVLSIPCSSGEEPYSLAMALLDLKVPPHRFLIDAVDISARALARAKHAVYGKNSFRGYNLAFRDQHFSHAKDGYTLNPRVRECVEFHRDNLLGGDFLVGHAPYDFIFCRNLLIYFDRATQVRALEKIHQLLTPPGVLFVGPAEVPLVADCGFANANFPMAFACRKAARNERCNTALPTAKRDEFRVSPTTRTTTFAEVTPATDNEFRRQAAAHVTPETPSDLDVARQLADAGRLEDAVAICEAHLRKEGPSAQAYYLLGLMRDAGGDVQAIEFYRKALYLEPNHYETLLHMSLLLEKSGNAAGARTFKRRAERASAFPPGPDAAAPKPGEGGQQKT